MANPFEKFLSFGKLDLWQKKNNQVIGIDIGTSSIKVVQLRKDKGRIILETYGELAVGPYRGFAVGQAAILNPEKQVEVIKDLFKEANITTAAGSFAVPLSSSLALIIEIPRVEKIALAKVIPLEARKYIPVPISEVAIDWWVIPQNELDEDGANRDKMEVLVVAIHNAVINQYQTLAKGLGVTTSFFEIETFSAIRSVFGGDLSATVILDIGASTTKMAIVDYGIVRLSHTINKGAQDITLSLSRTLGVDFGKAEEIKRRVGLVEHLDGQDISSTVSGIMEYIFSEVNDAVIGYQEKQRKAVSKIVFIGSGSLLRGLLPLAAKSFAVPVFLGRPFDKVESPAFLEKILSEAGPGFAVAIGLCLRELQNLE